MAELGRLEQVPLRTVWPEESGDFTPWLGQEENLRLLGDTIGIELELDSTEKEVGPFRADILCRNTADGSWVLVENQMEKTDHTHLGQLLTYAAGLDAVTIVWVAQRIAQEHRAALDWLNEITDERFNFFALEIELWRIGDSPIAPKFNVVCKPNDWSKSVKTGGLTEGQQLQVRFWTRFREFMEEHPASFKPVKPLPQTWMSMGIGKSGFSLVAVASLWDSIKKEYSGELRAEIVVSCDRAKEYFHLLEARKDEIERKLGESLVWENKKELKQCKVYFRKPADPKNESNWPDQHAWLRKKLDKLYTVFRPIVRDLEPLPLEAGEVARERPDRFSP